MIIWLQLAVVLLSVAAAVGVIRYLDRRSRREIVAAYGVPSSVDPEDFGGFDELTLLLFTHPDCRACLGARRVTRSLSVKVVEISEQPIMDRYGIDGVPTTLIVDSAGQVLKSWVGPLDPRSIRKALTELVD